MEDRAVREDEIKTKRQRRRDLKEGQLQCEMSQLPTSSSWTPPKNQGGKELQKTPFYLEIRWF